jgi:uncharacterized protein (DUF1499 family)
MALALGLGLALLAGGLLGNRVPLLDPPGVAARLRIYLTTHVAETSPRPRLPELAEPRYPVSPERLYDAVGAAIDALAWSRTSDPSTGEHRAVVTTRLLRFRDDLTARVVADGEGGSRLAVRSVSRVGRGDLGANARHAVDLLAAVSRALE